MRLVVLASLLLISGIVAAQDPVPGVYEPLDQSRCWECHGPGRDDPDMDPTYQAYLQPGEVPRGQDGELRFEVLNVWLGEMSDLTARVDLADSGLRVATEPVPVHEQRLDGVVPMQSEPATPPPGQAPKLPPRYDEQQATVPDGATAIRIRAVPDDQDPITGPDVSLEVVPERSASTYSSDNAGRGGAETVRFADLDAVLEAGYGNWTFIVRPGPDGASLLEPDTQPAPIPYHIEITAWTNTTGATAAILTAAGPVQPGAKLLLSLPVRLEAAPAQGSTIDMTINATYHWDHDTSSYPDDGYLHVPFTFPVERAGEQAVFGTTASPGTVVVQGVSLARISEAIGYVAGTLLLVSFVTGGVFGKASRRRLNVVFGSARRRVAYHNFVSYGLTLAAITHLIIFIVEIDWHWAHGLIWGGASLLSMLGLGVTGAMQVPLIRRWDYATWRRVHLGLAISCLLTAAGHMLLDGANFTAVPEWLGYEDPIVPDQ